MPQISKSVVSLGRVLPLHVLPQVFHVIEHHGGHFLGKYHSWHPQLQVRINDPVEVALVPIIWYGFHYPTAHAVFAPLKKIDTILSFRMRR